MDFEISTQWRGVAWGEIKQKWFSVCTGQLDRMKMRVYQEIPIVSVFLAGQRKHFSLLHIGGCL